GINIAGSLSFARDKDTRLDVGLIKIQGGDEYSEEGFDCDAHVMAGNPNVPRPALEVGTPNQPLPAGHTARIRLHFIEGMDKQSCPAIVCCGGRMDFHGAPLTRTWLKLGDSAAIGDTTVTLSEAPTGWKVGDQVIVTSTKHSYKGGGQPHSRTRTPIDASNLTLDKPLEYEHVGKDAYRAEVANLSRNVVIESANPDGERGHTMYHRDSAGAISYAEFRHLGKKDVLG